MRLCGSGGSSRSGETPRDGLAELEVKHERFTKDEQLLLEDLGALMLF